MRILIVGMADSVHLAKWLKQFEASDHDFRIFSSSPHRRIHTITRDLIQANPRYSMGWFIRVFALPLWIADRFLADWLRGLVIAIEAEIFQPDLVHVAEFQNGGYSYLRARKLSRKIRDVPLLLTPYGSDMFWFQRFPKHLKKIKELLSVAAGISSECLRDEQLAARHGFKGVYGPRIPASGSIPINPQIVKAPRNTIAIKGYQNQWGQALIALSALEGISEKLQGYQIELFSCNQVTLRAAKKFQQKTGLEVIAHPKGALTNFEVHELLGRSVALISLSTSDGVPASMLEAMANGAIPIQSNTGCCNEWLEDGVGGFLVDFDDKMAVQQSLLRILNDEPFRCNAIDLNLKRLNETISSNQTQAAAMATYELFIK